MGAILWKYTNRDLYKKFGTIQTGTISVKLLSSNRAITFLPYDFAIIHMCHKLMKKTIYINFRVKKLFFAAPKNFSPKPCLYNVNFRPSPHLYTQIQFYFVHTGTHKFNKTYWSPYVFFFTPSDPNGIFYTLRPRFFL